MKQITRQSSLASLLCLVLAGCSQDIRETEDKDDNGEISTNEKPVAVAQAPQHVSRTVKVELDASGSSDADNDVLSFTWYQRSGPDVTGGKGYLTGSSVSFYAPDHVATLQFELIANDGTDDSEPNAFSLTILENGNAAYFVDGDAGSDVTGTGSMENPFASIAFALCQITEDQEDIYVQSKANSAVYTETVDPCPGDPARNIKDMLKVPNGTSLYGAFNENWHRNVDNSTLVDTTSHGFIFYGFDEPAWFSGFNVFARDSLSPDESVQVLSALGGSAGLTIEDNQLMAGDVPQDLTLNPGSSYGVIIGHVDQVTMRRNLVASGNAGNALGYELTYPNPAASGKNGKNASGSTGGSGGDGAGAGDYDGGRGGDNGKSGGSGQTGTNNGKAGAAGNGGTGIGSLWSFDYTTSWGASYLCADGARGANGISGRGGNGGDGGDNAFPNNGGGGGGGGGGGAGGSGGFRGQGGCASIAVMMTDVPDAKLTDNTLISLNGGQGGSGGLGQTGGNGGSGGAGADGNCTIYCAGDGKNGKSGQKGGNGGRGGAGGGGPSIGLLIGVNMAPVIENNDITAANGGRGGDGKQNGRGGQGGHSYAIYDMDILDGMVPVQIANTLEFGTAGSGGSATGAGSANGSSGSSDTVNW